jgi:hypothetical protein
MKVRRDVGGGSLSAFEQSLEHTSPPAGVSDLLALWHERRGDWDRAHRITQEIPGAEAAWVHAYLHRREGDLPNASYWYSHAGRSAARGSLDDEWREIVETLLSRPRR